MAIVTSKILTSLITLAGKQGYATLSKKFGFYKFLSDLGIARPKDNFEQLYLHTVVLFAAKGHPRELIELILLDDCKKAFRTEIFDDESGAFLDAIDRELHVNSLVRNIKHWDEVPFGLIEEFFGIYNEMTGRVASPVQNKIIKQNDSISDQLDTGFSQVQQTLAMILETTGTDPLEKEYNRQLSLHIEKIEKGLFQSAVESLREMQQQILNKVKPALKFKILTNLGFCLYQLGENAEATDILVEAYGYNPDSIIALSNIVNAYLSLDDEPNAGRYLELLKQKFPEAPEYYSALLKLKCYDCSMHELEEMMPFEMRETYDGLVSLGLCARNKELFQESIAYLERARVYNDKDSHADLHLIQNYLEHYQADFKLANLKLLDEETKAGLEYTLRLVDSQILKISSRQMPNLLVQLYLAKSFLHQMLKQPKLFEEALNEGLRIDPLNTLLLKQKGIAFAFTERAKEAIEIFLMIKDPETFPDLPMIIAETYRNIGEVSKAIETLEDHFKSIQNDDRFIIQGRYILLGMYLKNSDDRKVYQWLELYGEKKYILDRIGSAKALWHLGQRETSSEMLLALIDGLMVSGTYREKYTMVECLVDQRLFDAAITLLEHITDFRTPSIMTQQLINLYMQKGKNLEALKLLIKIRVYNGPVNSFTLTEIKLYQQAKSYGKARRVAKEYIQIMPDDWEVLLLLSALNIRLELGYESDELLLRTDIPYLEFPFNQFKQFVGQLAARSLWGKMLTAVYEYRRVINDVDAHSLYIEALGQFPHLAIKNIVPEWAGPDAVVTLKNRANDKYVLTMEDRPSRELKESEINKENPKFEALSGKKIGETVAFEGNISPWEIEKLDNKYSHAYHETEYLLKTKFADTTKIKVIHVDEFWQYIETLQKDPEWKQNRKEIWGYYNDHKVTLGGVASLLGCSSIEAWMDATTHTKGLRVASGTPEEMAAAEGAARVSQPVCADITALLTLFQLDCAKEIIEIFGKFYITESTYDLVYNHECAHLIMPKANPQLGTFLDFVKNATIRQQPRQVIGINWLEQKKMHELLGLEFYETALLAKEIDALFYSDDYVFRNYIGKTYSLECAWTQSFLNVAAEKGLISHPVYEKSVLILIARHYKHTSITIFTFFEAFIQTNYKLEGVAEKCIDVLAGDSSSLETALPVAMDTLVDLWTKVPARPQEKVDLTRAVFMSLLNGRVVRDVIFSIKKRMTYYHQQHKTNESTYFLTQAGGVLKSISEDFIGVQIS